MERDSVALLRRKPSVGLGMAKVYRQGRFISRAAKWLVAAWAAGLMLGLAYFLAKQGPRNVILDPTPTRLTLTPEQRKLSDEIDLVEEHYRVVEAKGELTPAWAARLAQAVARQHELLRLNRHPDAAQIERLERLETARDNVRAGSIVARIVALEDLSGDGVEPSVQPAQWREALALQIEINRSRAAPRFKDFVRETRLSLQIEAAEAAPLKLEVVSAVEASQAAAEQSDWTSALQHKRKAHDALTEINRRFPRSGQADLRLQARLGEEIAALEPATVAAEVAAYARGGDAAMAAGRWEAAAELYEGARGRQEELNRTYGRSRFASAERVAEWEANGQTALAQVAMAEAVLLDEELSRLLLQRRLAAAGRRLEALRARLDGIAANYPRSRVLTGELRLKATLLARHWAEIAALHEHCYGMLVPVPGVKNLLMARTEVAQEFYAQIMGTNPSRQPGVALPVDSVEWAAATEFCQRLTWLLGTRVRLPTAQEFIQATGDIGQAGWSVANSQGRIHEIGLLPANVNGFHDLQGNVAEWLDAAVAAENAPVAGGSFLDAGKTANAGLLARTPKTQRARHIGFRFVVEYPLE